MKAFRFYISLSIFAILVSCRPEELPPAMTGDPVFSVSGGAVDISAGENDFYLFSTYEKDTLDVYSFIARFAKLSDCSTDCEEELVIEIRDAEQTPGATAVDIDNALKVGNYSYKVINPANSNDLVVINLTAEPEGSGPFIYKWTTNYNNNVDSFTTSNSNYSLSFQNNANTDFLSICLAIDNNSNCGINYCNTIYLNNNTPGCQADFSVFNVPAFFQVQLEADTTSGTPPFTFLWSNGSTGQILTEMHNGTLDETFCLTITDATGCTNEICKEVTIAPGVVPLICASRFSYEKMVMPGGGDSLQLSTVFIQYTDPNGQVYQSDFQQQPNTSNFVISSVEDYEENENGDKTKKLTVSGNCLLYDENGNSLDFPFEGIIAVAYPR